jgi:hypothetical protein
VSPNTAVLISSENIQAHVAANLLPIVKGFVQALPEDETAVICRAHCRKSRQICGEARPVHSSSTYTVIDKCAWSVSVVSFICAICGYELCMSCERIVASSPSPDLFFLIYHTVRILSVNYLVNNFNNEAFVSTPNGLRYRELQQRLSRFTDPYTSAQFSEVFGKKRSSEAPQLLLLRGFRTANASRYPFCRP